MRQRTIIFEGETYKVERIYNPKNMFRPIEYRIMVTDDEWNNFTAMSYDKLPLEVVRDIKLNDLDL